MMGLKAEEPDYQKQFEAAVRVIQSLPKNGSYRPSYEEMLRFYSYYKQAVVGQCQTPRPGFWDPIGRYKWDAWNSLGKMTKKEAMAAYIAEMKKAAQKVINTVPMDESSEDMFVYFKPLYEVIPDMPRPPESFFKNKTGMPISSKEPVHNITENSQMTGDTESEIFCDSLEQVAPDQARRVSAKQIVPLSKPHSIQAGEQSGHKPSVHALCTAREGELNKAGTTDVRQALCLKKLSSTREETDPQTSPDETVLSTNSPEAVSENLADVLIQQEVNLQVTSTIQALQQDVKEVMERLSYLESWAALQDHREMLNPSPLTILHDGKELPRWPVHLSPPTWFFLLTWPFIAQLLLWCFQRQKR
ncbi:acyl-CoA-binding domain-containing protein 4 isoform X1 [Varanus komodoensis]|uniref:acyl-CoA-binding domain-containing protein 4 isoform X1 n=1 Tax=Varanus komodoensis TaxID=61221 RepID=UPI001CF7CDA0|nr:acyl-CoA-binding domain-containing protein 4 isoform X1 [Varanus komodoensis]XP_044303014.1 acyl-CoA-binding domain-containing protein 4 isoform X1 [Varanus komodoensis]